MSKSMVRWSTLAASVLLTACGGGGGGDVGSGGSAQSASFEVAGSAVKGPMKNAKVTVFRINAAGEQGEKLGEGTSVDAGAYSIKYQSDYTGPILVEVEATADTEILDEDTGTVIRAPGLKMRAALQPPAGGDGQLSVQINPLTEVAVADAARKGGLTLANIEKANADLAESLGFNPQADAPAFDANNKPTNKAAVMLAAISKLANEGDLTACGSGSAGDKVKCVVGEIAKSATGLVGVTALQAKVDAVAAVANVTPPVISAPSGTPVTETTAVAQAKALMNTLRSNAKALDASDLSLQTEVSALEQAVSTAVQPVVDSTFEMLRTMDFGVQMLEAARNGSGVYSQNRTGLQYGAGCTVYTDDTFLTEAKDKDNAKTVGCSSYVALNRNVQDSVTGVQNTWRWRHRLLIAPKADVVGTYTVRTTARREYGTCASAAPASCGTFTQTFSGTPNQGKPATVGTYTDNSAYVVQRGELGVAEFTRTAAASGEVTALRLTGTTAPSLYYQGLGVSPVLDEGRGRRHEVELDAVKTVSNGVQRFSLNSDGFIKFFSSNAAGETYFVSSVGIGKDSFLEGPVAANSRDGTEKMDLRIGYVAGNSAVRGQLAASDAMWDKTSTYYTPTKITFGGRLERRESAAAAWVEFLRGSVVTQLQDFASFSSDQPVSSSNQKKIKATTNLVVTIPTRPVLVLRDWVADVTNFGDSESVNLSGQYVQGSAVINVSGLKPITGASVLSLESTTGIKLLVDGAKSVHPMTKSGVKVGEYNANTGRLSYVDGSFEQY